MWYHSEKSLCDKAKVIENSQHSIYPFQKGFFCGYFAGPGKIAPRGYFDGPGKIVCRLFCRTWQNSYNIHIGYFAGPKTFYFIFIFFISTFFFLLFTYLFEIIT